MATDTKNPATPLKLPAATVNSVVVWDVSGYSSASIHLVNNGAGGGGTWTVEIMRSNRPSGESPQSFSTPVTFTNASTVLITEPIDCSATAFLVAKLTATTMGSGTLDGYLCAKADAGRAG